MMRLSPEATRLALRRYVEVYVSGKPAWSIDHQLELYEAAERAFEGRGDSEAFGIVYDALRSYWQVFRNAQDYWDIGRAHQKLIGLDASMRRRRLSSLADSDWPRVWDVIRRIRRIKQNKSGVSLVAISKFLHFWNPRVFLIFDSAAVEGWVFEHQWLSSQLPTGEAARALCGRRGPVDRDDERLLTYFQALVFASEFVKANGHIRSAFGETVRKHAGGSAVPRDIETYEATAVEWCLLGLVELPPAGVVFSRA